MNFVELEKLLKKDGWYYLDTVGCHIQYKHKTKSGKITIPKHRGNVKKETLATIIKQAGLKKEE